ncbi:unnamed protein product [Blepharisma stoltei]|uniref:Uncharacterized protein n=1 Tax=Blepharisma stoltei TaxID=1481888 RepID=A0AAU9JFH2_9CILI|nr:unnamed protein product [Blepharisma stoltei]
MSNEESGTEQMLSNRNNDKIRVLLIDKEDQTDSDTDEDFEIPTKLNFIHYFCILLVVGLLGCTLAATIYAWIK